jgi:hypothetical protein
MTVSVDREVQGPSVDLLRSHESVIQLGDPRREHTGR